MARRLFARCVDGCLGCGRHHRARLRAFRSGRRVDAARRLPCAPGIHVEEALDGLSGHFRDRPIRLGGGQRSRWTGAEQRSMGVDDRRVGDVAADVRSVRVGSPGRRPDLWRPLLRGADRCGSRRHAEHPHCSCRGELRVPSARFAGSGRGHHRHGDQRSVGVRAVSAPSLDGGPSGGCAALQRGISAPFRRHRSARATMAVAPYLGGLHRRPIRRQRMGQRRSAGRHRDQLSAQPCDGKQRRKPAA